MIRWDWPYLILFSVSTLPTAVSSVSLKFMLLEVGVVLVVFLLVMNSLAVNYFVEGRGGVKFILLREEWLKVDERCSSGGSNAPKRVRNVSIKYETAGIRDGFSGEDFQNIGTLIVVRSSVFSISSVQKTHLARDAYNAYWDTA